MHTSIVTALRKCHGCLLQLPVLWNNVWGWGGIGRVKGHTSLPTYHGSCTVFQFFPSTVWATIKFLFRQPGAGLTGRQMGESSLWWGYTSQWISLCWGYPSVQSTSFLSSNNMTLKCMRLGKRRTGKLKTIYRHLRRPIFCSWKKSTIRISGSAGMTILLGCLSTLRQLRWLRCTQRDEGLWMQKLDRHKTKRS
jgi:hypothetical protein